MFVLVQHQITDAGTFWPAAKQVTDKAPSDLKFHHGLPAADNSCAFCLWEGKSVDAVRNHLEPVVGKSSRNTYYPVNAEKAMGLPAEALSR